MSSAETATDREIVLRITDAGRQIDVSPAQFRRLAAEAGCQPIYLRYHDRNIPLWHLEDVQGLTATAGYAAILRRRQRSLERQIEAERRQQEAEQRRRQEQARASADRAKTLAVGAKCKSEQSLPVEAISVLRARGLFVACIKRKRHHVLPESFRPHVDRLIDMGRQAANGDQRATRAFHDLLEEHGLLSAQPALKQSFMHGKPDRWPEIS